MTKQACQLQQSAGIVAQVAKREGVAQRVRRNRNPLGSVAKFEMVFGVGMIGL